jgi:hypothetical protein
VALVAACATADHALRPPRTTTARTHQVRGKRWHAHRGKASQRPGSIAPSPLSAPPPRAHARATHDGGPAARQTHFSHRWLLQMIPLPRRSQGKRASSQIATSHGVKRRRHLSPAHGGVGALFEIPSTTWGASSHPSKSGSAAQITQTGSGRTSSLTGSTTRGSTVPQLPEKEEACDAVFRAGLGTTVFRWLHRLCADLS